MKITLIILFSLLIGFVAGWLVFRAKYVSDFHGLMQKADITEDQLIEGYKDLPTIISNMEDDSRMATIISLAALRSLESGKTEETMRFLAKQPASYFVIYGPPGHPEKKFSAETLSTLKAIEKARKESHILDQTILESLKNVNK